MRERKEKKMIDEKEIKERHKEITKTAIDRAKEEGEVTNLDLQVRIDIIKTLQYEFMVEVIKVNKLIGNTFSIASSALEVLSERVERLEALQSQTNKDFN